MSDDKAKPEKDEKTGRFWSKVGKSGSCWVWMGSLDTGGYGSFRLGDKNVRSHRVAYELAYGPIPKGEGHHGTVVMHECDNRRCCNPAHLKIGTHADNMSDMKAKGRRKKINTCSRNGRAKLTAEAVMEIKSDPRSNAKCAVAYNVSKAQIQRIRTGKQWVAESNVS